MPKIETGRTEALHSTLASQAFGSLANPIKRLARASERWRWTGRKSTHCGFR